MGKAKSIAIVLVCIATITIVYKNIENKQMIDKYTYLNTVGETEYNYSSVYLNGIQIYRNEKSNMLRINTDDAKYKMVVNSGDKSSLYSIEGNSEEYIVLPYKDTEHKINIYEAVEDKVVVLDTINIKSITEYTGDYIGASYYSDYRDVEILRKKSEKLWNKSNYIEEYIDKCLEYISEFEYDNDKAIQIMEGNIKMYKPDIQYTMENKRGICMDIASALAAILRVQGIPASVCFGYKDDLYHAWIEIYYKDEWKIIDSLFGVNEVNGDKAIGYKVESRN